MGGAGGVELLDDDEAVLVVRLHLRHLRLHQLLPLLQDVAPEQLRPVDLDRLLPELPQLDLRRLVQHQLDLEVFVKQEHVLEGGVGLFDDLEDK